MTTTQTKSQREPFVAPSLGRGAGSWCALDGRTLDCQHFSPMVNGTLNLDAECRRLAVDLAAGEAVSFTYSCLTAFRVRVLPEAAIDGGFPSWVGPGRPGFYRLELQIGQKGRRSVYYHPLRGDSMEYVKSKHRLKEHDARAIAYLLGALGEAVREVEAGPTPEPSEVLAIERIHEWVYADEDRQVVIEKDSIDVRVEFVGDGGGHDTDAILANAVLGVELIEDHAQRQKLDSR